ncbi:MAG: efflux RND transporter periplasmic adaptor subunit [Verrucomicrobiia bacterium]
MNPTEPESLRSPARDRKNNAPHRRRWIPYGGAILLVALIVVGLWPQPIPVETARAQTGALRATVNEEGKTRIKERFLVAAPTPGHLRRTPLEAGDKVERGCTIVAVVDPLPPVLLDVRSRAQAEAVRDAARASLEKARAAHRFAKSELERFEKLFADGAVSVQEFEPVQWRETAAARDVVTAESELRRAEAELAQFETDPNSAAASRSPTEILAPASGRVLRVFEESARVVSAGMPLMEIGDPTDLEVVVEVLSRDGATITPGTKVELVQWGGGSPLQARVRQVEPAAFTKVSALGVEEQRVNMIADIVSPAGERPGLGDGFRVEARIIVWEADQVLKVPSGALFRRGDAWAAFVLDGGRARLRNVEAGRSSGTETQVLGGLKEGDEVILYPGDRVQDGQRVRPIQIANSN